VQESARESKLVKRSETKRGEAIEAAPRGIARQIVQYVHSGTIHTFARRGGKKHDRVSSRASHTR